MSYVNERIFLRFCFPVFSLVSISIEKIYQTLETEFNQISTTSKLVKNTSLSVIFSTLSSLVGIVVKHGLPSFDILFKRLS